MQSTHHFSFQLESTEDFQPPFSVETLPFSLNTDGSYKLLVPPLFVKELSVGDSLEITADESGVVNTWKTLDKSKRSTVWVLVANVDKQLYEKIFEQLRTLDCNTVQCPNFGLVAIDIPQSINLIKLESLLDQFAEDDVGYPSYRHED